MFRRATGYFSWSRVATSRRTRSSTCARQKLDDQFKFLNSLGAPCLFPFIFHSSRKSRGVTASFEAAVVSDERCLVEGLLLVEVVAVHSAHHIRVQVLLCLPGLSVEHLQV